MSQQYPFANFSIDGKVVTMIMVAESGIATPELAQRSMSAFKQRLKKEDVVLVAKGVSLAPTYVGPRSFVDKLKDIPLNRIPWNQVEI